MRDGHISWARLHQKLKRDNKQLCLISISDNYFFIYTYLTTQSKPLGLELASCRYVFITPEGGCGVNRSWGEAPLPWQTQRHVRSPFPYLEPLRFSASPRASLSLSKVVRGVWTVDAGGGGAEGGRGAGGGGGGGVTRRCRRRIFDRPWRG